MNTDYFQDINKQVELVSTASTTKELTFDGTANPFPVIEYTVKMRRKAE